MDTSDAFWRRLGSTARRSVVYDIWIDFACVRRRGTARHGTATQMRRRRRRRRRGDGGRPAARGRGDGLLQGYVHVPSVITLESQ